MIIWTVAGIVVGIVALLSLGWAYLAMLKSLFPEKVRTSEVYDVTTPDLWKIRVCRYRKGRNQSEPVLLVHGCGSNQHNLATPAGACLADYLAEKGYDVWAVDLRGCRSSEAPFERFREDATIDDQMQYDLPAVIKFIRHKTSYNKVHYVGHSLGGMLLYAHCIAQGADHIASAATLGSPPGFHGVRWRKPRTALWLARTFPLLAGDLLRGYIPFGILLRIPLRVMPMNMRNRHPKVGVSALYAMADDPLPKVVDELFFMIEKKQWTMQKGALKVGERLNTLQVPLLAIYGARDPLVPIAEAEKFFERLPHDDKKLIILAKTQGASEDYGHVDLAFGKKGASEVYEPIAKWFAAHPIGESVPKAELEEAPDETYRKPLEAGERADILSGESFAHITSDPDESDEDAPSNDEEDVSFETPAIFEEVERSEESPARKQALSSLAPASELLGRFDEAGAEELEEAGPDTPTLSESPGLEAMAPAPNPKSKKALTRKKATSGKAPAKKKSAAKKKPAAKKKTSSAASSTKTAAATKKKASAKKKAASPKKPTAKKATAKKSAAKKTASPKAANQKASTKPDEPSKATRSAIQSASENLNKLLDD